MAEWKEYRVGEIFNIQNGYAFKSGEFVENSDDTYEVLKIGHIEIGGGLRTDPKKTYVKRNSKYKKWVLEKNDIVMGMTDMKSNVVILGIPALVDKNDTYVLNQRVARLSLKDPHSFDIYFCYYQMLWNEFTTELRKTANSGVQVNLTTSGISTTILYVPNYELQRKIGRLLSSLDDKIELNRKINANLEAQAQALFKSWFVDFEPFKDQPFVESELGMIPEGWKVGKLGELCTFKRGKNLLTKDAIDEGVPVVAGGLEPSCYHNVSNTKSPVVTVSGSGANAGFMRMYYQEVWASDCSFIDSTCENLLFVYCFLSINRRLLRHAQTGAVQPHVKPSDIHDFDIVIPPKRIIEEFQTKIQESIQMRGNIEKENSRLASLRDTLLPRLMSGELKVNEVI